MPILGTIEWDLLPSQWYEGVDPVLAIGLVLTLGNEIPGCMLTPHAACPYLKLIAELQ